MKAGRAGWFAKGIVYTISGFLAIAVAVRASGWTTATAAAGKQEASPTGAIKAVAGTGGGTLLLWLLAIGMLLYAAWRVVSALLPGGTDAKAMVQRAGFTVSAVIYTSFAISAITLARHPGKAPNGNTKVTDISASIMRHNAGRVAVALVGVIVIAAGLYRFSKGVTMDVDDELDLTGLSPARVAWSRRLGAVGEVGRGIGIGLVGVFLFLSAINYNPSEATGLDGALRRLAIHSWGRLVVAIVGIGFATYGLFCLVTFTRRRLQAPG